MNDLQPLVDGRLEPVVEARQGQHLGVPVREERAKTSLFHQGRAEKKAESSPPPLLTFQTNNQAAVTKCHFGLTENQLEREELSEAFQDFQGDEELKDGLSHGLSQSGALLLQSPADSLHGHAHIIGHLKREKRTSKREWPRPRLPLVGDATCFSSCL